MLLLSLFFLLGVAALSVTAAVGTNLAALSALLAAPGQFGLLVRDRHARRNLALGHATVNILRQRSGHSGLVALASPAGFVVRGGASPAMVADAASEALARLRAGERTLAVDPRSAAALLATEMGLAAAVVAVLLLTDTSGLAAAIAGLALVALVGPRLSSVLQRHLTTDAHLGSLAIRGIQIEAPSGIRGLLTLVMLGPVLVQTSDVQTAAPVDRQTPPMRETIAVENFTVR